MPTKKERKEMARVLAKVRARRAPDSSALIEKQAVASDEPMTYGQRATKGLKFAGQRKNGRVLCLTRVQLTDLLDDAYFDGEREKTNWAKGMIEAKNSEIKGLLETLAQMRDQRRLDRWTINVMLEKLGVRLDTL